MSRLLSIALCFSAFIAMSTSSSFAEQDFQSGNYMLQHCKRSVSQHQKYDVWEGWCAGAMATLRFVGEALPTSRFCPPKSSTVDQATRIAVQYMESHPDTLHQDFKWLAIQALHKAWPCPASPK